MTIKFNIKIIVVLGFIFLIEGCEWRNEIAIVKNNSKKSIFIIYTLGKTVTDSSVGRYYHTLKEYTIEPGSFKKLTTYNRTLRNEPDSSKIYLYVFNIDSLKKYEKVSKYEGILNHSVIKKVEIQINKIKYPIDTLYVVKRDN
jgi:hypothetical protein